MESAKKTEVPSANTQNTDDLSQNFTEFKDDNAAIENPTSYMIESDDDDNLTTYSEQYFIGSKSAVSAPLRNSVPIKPRSAVPGILRSGGVPTSVPAAASSTFSRVTSNSAVGNTTRATGVITRVNSTNASDCGSSQYSEDNEGPEDLSEQTDINYTPNAYLRNQCVSAPLLQNFYRNPKNRSSELVRSNAGIATKSAAPYKVGKAAKTSRPNSRPTTPKHSPLPSNSRDSSLLLNNYQKGSGSKLLTASSGVSVSNISSLKTKPKQGSLGNWESAPPADIKANTRYPYVHDAQSEAVESKVTNQINSIASPSAEVEGLQNLKDTLLRGTSYVRVKEDLELVKSTLARSKSTISKKNGESNQTPPVLFAQDKESISRSQSVMRQMISGIPSIDTGSTLPHADELWNASRAVKPPRSAKSIDVKKEVDVFNEGPGNLKEGDNPEPPKQTYNLKSNPSEDNTAGNNKGSVHNIEANENEVFDEEADKADDENLEASSKFNLMTQETELNCMKDKKRKLRRNIFQFSPPFRQFYVGENPKLSKASGGNFWSSKTGDTSVPVKKGAMEKSHYIIIWVLFVLLMASLCTLIPMLIIYSRGTSNTVKNYLDNTSPAHRNEIIKNYLVEVNAATPAKSIETSNFTQIPLTFQGNNSEPDIIIPNLSSSIAGITSFKHIPKKYLKNSQISALTNNTNLRNVFYGVDYAPRNVIYPMCGVTQSDVMLDIALLSQVTSRVRTYGTQCDQAKYVLDSIVTLKLNMSLALGVWIGPNEDINRQQLNDMKNLLKSYPRKYFETIFIGNEVLFREDQSIDNLVKYIYETKHFVQKELKWDLPVGTSELGSKADLKLMKATDVFGSNIHPFFNGESVQGASKWVYDFLKYQVEPVRAQIEDPAQIPQIVISEVGWPYQGGNYNNAVAGKRQMQYFLNNWVCDTNATYPWYYFEAFDEPWKQVYHREGARWETEWGLFTPERQLKDGVVFPTC